MASSADLSTTPVADLLRMLDASDLTSVELTRSVLNAISERDGAIGAYVHLDEEDALRQAEEADQRRSRGESGVLLGIPIALKDLLNVKGQPCTCSSNILEGYTSPYDATVVARLREAGAVLLGRVNMDEFAMGASTEHSRYGSTRNPWNTDHVPGGSSGGSAAVISAGTAVAAIGTDTGGSIRQPAAFCGCVGLKPSYGRVSRYGVTAFASSLDQVGPLCRTVEDAALVLQAIAGSDDRDSTSLSEAVPDYRAALTEDLSGMRLGVPGEYFGEGVSADVAARVKEAIEVCRGLGAEIVEIDLPHTRYAIPAYYVIAPAEASANLARFDGVRYGTRAADPESPLDLYRRSREAGFGDEVKRRIILGTFVLSSGYHDAYYIAAQKVRTLIRQDFDKAFAQCDAIVAPVTPTCAPALGDGEGDPLKVYAGDVLTVPANLAGICGLSVPCGFSEHGLPVGLQIMGDVLQEETILKVGHAYESATDWPRVAPTGDTA